jgi:hypothetical protein
MTKSAEQTARDLNKSVRTARDLTQGAEARTARDLNKSAEQPGMTKSAEQPGI